MIFRYFSKLPSIVSPLSQYVEKISEVNLMAEISKRARKELPQIKEQISTLKDIEQASIFQMKTLPNDKIILIAKAYTLLEQGSHHLYSNLTREIFKRVNSFSIEELSTIAYFLSSIKESGRLFNVIKNLVLKDPMGIQPSSIGKLSFAFAIQEKYDADLYNILGKIFIAAKDEVNLDSGFLFLTGIYKVKHVNPAILTTVEYFVDKFWDQFTGEETAHVIYVLYKLGLEGFGKMKIDKINLEKMKVGDIDKIIGCFIARNIDPPVSLVNKLESLIDDLSVSASEMFELIYSVNSLKNSEKFFVKIEEVLGKTMKVMSNKEKILIFLAILNTKRENLRVLEMFSTEFEGLFEVDDVLVLFPCFVRRNSVFLPYTQRLIDMVADKFRGKDIKTQDALLVMYSLSKVGYKDEVFWKACIDYVRYCKISSADEYIQVKKTVREIGKLGIDVENCLSELVRKYEEG